MSKNTKSTESARTEVVERLQESEERYFKLAEVEEILSVSRSTLKRWIKSKKIKAVKFGDDVSGNPWRITATDLEAFKTKNTRSNGA